MSMFRVTCRHWPIGVNYELQLGAVPVRNADIALPVVISAPWSADSYLTAELDRIRHTPYRAPLS